MKHVLTTMFVACLFFGLTSPASGIDLYTLNQQRMAVGLTPLIGGPTDIPILSYECQNGIGASCMVLQAITGNGGMPAQQPDPAIRQLQCNKLQKDLSDCLRNQQNMQGITAMQMARICDQYSEMAMRACSNY